MARSLAHDATKFEPRGSRTLSDTIVAALDRDSGLRREYLRKRWQGVSNRRILVKASRKRRLT